MSCRYKTAINLYRGGHYVIMMQFIVPGNYFEEI